MYPCSAVDNSQSRPIQLEWLIAKLELTCRATTLPTTALANSQWFRSFDHLKSRRQSSSSRPERASVFKNRSWPTKRRRRVPRGRHAPPSPPRAREVARFICQGRSSSPIHSTPRPRHSLLSTMAVPLSPCRRCRAALPPLHRFPIQHANRSALHHSTRSTR
jgi:hypothetical protein